MGHSLRVPLDLNLDTYCAETPEGSQRYHLKGIVCHSGPSKTSGHYTALVKKQSQWFYCDDNRVTKAPLSNVKKWLSEGLIQSDFTPTILLYEQQ